MKIAVIGGGWAGLAAAVELASGGAKTSLFEAGRVVGGRARSVVVDGRTLDNGQHILLGAYHETLSLMRRVGADPDALFDRRPLQIIDNTGFRLALPFWPVPFNVVWGLLTATPVNWTDKFRTALWMDRLKRRGFVLDREMTVAAWLDAAGQAGALRRHLWEPLCLAALNTPVERASAQLFANVLRDSLGSSRRAATDLLLPRAPLGKILPEPAVRWLIAHGAELRLGHRVRCIEDDLPAGIAIDGEVFDAAILAVAPQHLGALWPAATADIGYEPIATIYLDYATPPALPFPLNNRLGGLGQWLVDRGQGRLVSVLSGHGEWESLSDDALAAALTEELGFGRPHWQRVIREKRATFSARPGLKRVDWQTTHPGLLIAGDHTWADYPATLEGAVRSGLRAARQLLAGR